MDRVCMGIEICEGRKEGMGGVWEGDRIREGINR